jgi:copper transport protein
VKAGLLASALVLLLATGLLAHGALRRAMPGAGDRVPAPRLLWLEFTEAVELAGTVITLADAKGAAVPLAPPVHPGDSSHVIAVPVAGTLAPGAYRVAWQVTGRDGHPVRGRYAFEVIAGSSATGTAAAGSAVGPLGTSGFDATPGGPPRDQSATDSPTARNPDDAPLTPSAQPAPDTVGSALAGSRFTPESGAYVALRWLSYVMLVAAIGAVVMARIADRAATVGARFAVQTRLAAIGLAAAWLGLALALARLLAQSWAVHGPERAMSATLIGPLIGTSTWGRAWAIQLAGAILAATGFTLALHDARRSGGWRIARLAVLIAAAGTALGGHAAAAEGWRAPVLIAADFAHVLAAGAWIGGVMMLAVAVLTRAAAPAAANVVRAFSPWGLTGAATLAVTGLVAAWAHLETPLAPWSSHYGRVLLVKLAFVAVIVLLGALNWRRLGPASGTGSGNAALRRAVWLEVLTALAVLAATAVLVAVDPSRP